MAYIGKVPTAVPLSSADIEDGTIQLADLSATGTKDATTFLRGDNTFAEAGGGKVLQVVSNTCGTVISTTSTSFVYVTGAPSVDITPSSTSSKILILSHFGTLENSAGTGSITIFRGGTNLGDSTNGVNFHQPDGTSYAIGGVSLLDNPATTSSITYQIRLRNTGGTIEISRNAFSTITALEIGA